MVSAAVIAKVLQKATEVATHSWEYGTVAEALLEWNNPDLSIWNNPFPDSSGHVPKLNVDDISALSYVKPHISLNGNTLVDGDGSAGDPAALGIPAVMIGGEYGDAAARQIYHLLADVPRWPKPDGTPGAISHRESHPELWADFIYMVPPFLAYYGVATNQPSMLAEAANQCKYYYDVLEQQSGAWMHIVTMGEGNGHTSDHALWSTGNAWAAAGMARVLATLKKVGFSGQDQMSNLVSMIQRILDAAIAMDNDSSGLLRNYLDQGNWWGEISGTSLLAATALRMAKLEPGTFGQNYVDWAEKKMNAVDGKINEENGIVGPAINPMDWHDWNQYWSGSPEGQSFVVLMHAAYRDLKG